METVEKQWPSWNLLSSAFRWADTPLPKQELKWAIRKTAAALVLENIYQFDIAFDRACLRGILIFCRWSKYFSPFLKHQFGKSKYLDPGEQEYIGRLYPHRGKACNFRKIDTWQNRSHVLNIAYTTTLVAILPCDNGLERWGRDLACLCRSHWKLVPLVCAGLRADLSLKCLTLGKSH